VSDGCFNSVVGHWTSLRKNCTRAGKPTNG
jgi:hypothetical protein